MTAWSEILTNAAATWATTAGRASWHGGVALAACWVACRAMPWAPAWVKSWLWRLAYARLLLALVWAAPVDLPLLPQSKPAEQSERVGATADDPAARRPLPSGVRRGTDATAVVGTSAPAPARVDAAATSAAIDMSQVRAKAVAGQTAGVANARPGLSRSPQQPQAVGNLGGPELLAAMWAAGFVAGVLWLLTGWRRMRSLHRRARPVRPTTLWATELAGLAESVGLSRVPQLVTIDGLTGPLVTGVWRPAVILPAAWLHDGDGWRCRDLRPQLAHELAHVRRLDLAWNWLAASAHLVFWFHPLVWLAAREWRFTQEAACDEAAIAATAAPSAAYAAVLVQAATTGNSSAVRLAGGPWAACVSPSLRTLKRRLTHMRFALRTPSSSRHRRWAGLVAVAMAVAGLPGWQLVAARAVEPPTAGEKAAATGPAAAADLPPPSTRPAGTATTPAERPVAAGHQAFVGVVTARTADLLPLEGGLVQAVNFKEGQAVKAGSVLAQFNDKSHRLQVAAAEADLKQREVALKRKQELYAELIARGGTNTELREVEAAVEIGRIAVAYRQAERDRTVVRAPFDGTVVSVSVAVGQVWDGTKPLGTMVEAGPPAIEFYVPVGSLGSVKVGTQARVVEVMTAGGVPDQGAARPLDATIQFVSPVAEFGSGIVKVKARLSRPGELLPGTAVKVALVGQR